MEIEYIRQFALLARDCHFQSAADELFISQSTLSKHIAALEKELGQKLFHRTTRQVELTDFGRAFLPDGRENGLSGHGAVPRNHGIY